MTEKMPVKLKPTGPIKKCPVQSVYSETIVGKRLSWGQMKLLIENNLLGHNRTMKSPVKNKWGTLYGCPLYSGGWWGERGLWL